jgi:hypothetical protein
MMSRMSLSALAIIASSLVATWVNSATRKSEVAVFLVGPVDAGHPVGGDIGRLIVDLAHVPDAHHGQNAGAAKRRQTPKPASFSETYS